MSKKLPAALVGVAMVTLAFFLSPGLALAGEDEDRRLRAALRSVELGRGVISVDIRDSLFGPDGEFRAGDAPAAQLVDVVFRAAPNLTNKMTRRGIELDMVDGYVAIFMTRIPIQQATMEAHMTLSDGAGNEALGAVYGTSLHTDDARPVNWSAPESVRWKRVWSVYLMNAAFR